MRDMSPTKGMHDAWLSRDNKYIVDVCSTVTDSPVAVLRNAETGELLIEIERAGIPDRKLWIKAAAEKYPYMDIDRVGIYGCSAGGQESATAVISILNSTNEHILHADVMTTVWTRYGGMSSGSDIR